MTELPHPVTVPPTPVVPPTGSLEVVPHPLLELAGERHADLAQLLAKSNGGLGDPDLIHDVRVASRRLGEVARLFTRAGGLFDKPTAKAVESSLRALRRSMGDLRDADVTVEHLRKWRMPAPLKHVARALAQEHAARRPALEKAGAAQLASASLAGTMVILARAMEQPGASADEVEEHLQRALKALIKKRDKQLRRSFGKAALKQSPESLHAARIAVKKLRYLWELAEPVTPGAAGKVRELKQFQGLLGDHHDAHVIVAHLAVQVTKPQEKLVQGLVPAWRKWCRELERPQARRAGEFFVKAYGWLNR